MDQFYYESGYIDESYFVYTADAQASVESSSLVTATAGVIKSTAVSLTAEFTQTSTLSNLQGADLFAFAEALLSAQATVIKDNNIQLSSVFSTAVDGSRGIYVTAQADSLFSISTSNQRVRNTEAASVAAFALNADVTKIDGGTIVEADGSWICNSSLEATISHIEGADLIVFSNASITIAVTIIKQAISNNAIEFNQTILANVTRNVISNNSSEFNQTLTANRTRDILSNQSSEFTQSSDIERIQSGNISVTSQSDLFVVISHIEGADLIINNFATLNTTASVNYNSLTIINVITSSETFIGSIKSNNSASLTTYSSVQIRGDVSYDRPWLLKSIAGDPYIDIEDKKFGAGSLRADAPGSLTYYATDDLFNNSYYSNDITIDFWFKTNSNSPVAEVFRYGPPLGTQFITLSHTGVGGVSISINGLAGTFSLTSIPIDSWNHLAFQIRLIPGSNRIVAWRNGSRVLNATSANTAIYPSGAKEGKLFFRGIQKIDDFRIRNVGSYNLDSTVITVPAVQAINTVDTVFLAHYNNNFSADTTTTSLATALLISTVALQSSITGPVKAESSIVSQSSLIATIGKLNEIIFLAFTDGSLNLTITRIQEGSCDLKSQFSLFANNETIKNNNSIFESEFFNDIIGERIRDNFITSEILSNQLTFIEKTLNQEATLTSQFNTEINVSKNTENIIVVNSLFTPLVTVNITNAGIANIESQFNIVTNANVINYGIAELLTETIVAIDEIILRELLGNVSSQFVIEITSSGVIDLQSTMPSTTSIEIIADRFAIVDSLMINEFTTIINTADSLNKIAESNLQSTSNLTTTILKIQEGIIATDSVASELISIAIIGNGLITIESAFVVDCQINKIVNPFKTIDSQFDLILMSSKLLSSAISNLENISTINVEGTTNITGEADFISESLLSLDADKINAGIANFESTFTLTAESLHIRPLAALVMSAGIMQIDTTRIRDNEISTDSIASELIIINVLIENTAHLLASFEITIETSVIHIIPELTWNIPREGREYKIYSETRVKIIDSETREYKIGGV